MLDAENLALSECGGECKSEFAHGGKKPTESESGNQKVGAGTSDNVLGEKTSLATSCKVEAITRNACEGPSVIETSHFHEGEQKAGRTTKENYQKYKKMFEEVLDSEPIPLGNRLAIRKYFKMIRPSGFEGDTKEAPAGK